MKIFFKVAALLFIVMTGCATTKPAVFHRAFQDDVEEARKLVSTGHLKQAVDELTLLIDMDPKNTEARWLRGVAYQNLEQFDSAIKDYENLIEIKSDAAKAHYNLGMIFAYKLKDSHRALEHFDHFLSLSPDQNRAFTVAKIMCSLDNAEASSLDPQLTDQISKASEIPNLSERRKQIESLTKQFPKSPIAFYTLGQAAEADGKKDDAIQAYRDAIAIRPTCAPCQHALGQLLLTKKKSQTEAEQHLFKAKLFDPNGSQRVSTP